MPVAPPFGNRVLDLLPEAESAKIAPRLEAASMPRGTVIYRAGEELPCVYFPTSCVLSAVTVMKDGTGVEIGTIGREGIGGVQVALGVTRVPSEMVCQVEGTTLRMSIADFVSSMDHLPQFRLLVHRYTQSVINFLSQSVACNRLHNLNERSARWLLMTGDRVGSDEFYLTQEFLAYMLGVRRSGVTIAAGTLHQAGFISYRRGHIKILDREGLESAACECYAIISDEFERLLAMPHSQPARAAPVPHRDGKHSGP